MPEQEFNLKPSGIYNLLIAGMLIISAAVVITLPFVIWAKLAGLAVLMVYGFYLFWCFGCLRGHDAVISLKPEKEGWRVKTRKTVYSANLIGDSVVTPYISILRFKVENQFKKPACVIFRDSLYADGYRRLVVACRFGKKLSPARRERVW